MKSTPILFSPPMVRAILEGRKTQTRRIVKLSEKFAASMTPKAFSYLSCDGGFVIDTGDGMFMDGIRCTYGETADCLWVREEHYRFGHWEMDTEHPRTKTGRQKWKFVADTDEVLYEAPAEFRKGRHHKDPATKAWHKRLARFMPKAFSRITLEVESVRVERLQDISEADSKAEGMFRSKLVFSGPSGSMFEVLEEDEHGPKKYPLNPIPESAYTYRVGFLNTWTLINGGESWNSNPWVWVITFKRI